MGKNGSMQLVTSFHPLHPGGDYHYYALPLFCFLEETWDWQIGKRDGMPRMEYQSEGIYSH